MNDDARIYRIRRFYQERGRAPHTLRSHVTLAEAQAHCHDPRTKGEGWFDGYDHVRGYKPKKPV